MRLDYPTIEDEVSFDLNMLAFEKIKSCSSSKKIISFRYATEICGKIFHLSRSQTFQFLKRLEREKLIKIYPYKGIEVLK